MSISQATPVRLSRFESIPELLLQEAHQRISQRAYELFLNRGCLNGDAGDAVGDWLAAESDVIASLPVEIRLSAQDITIEIVLPHENPPELTVYFSETRLVVVAALDSDGKQVLQPFDLPERISMDGVSADQMGCTLRITAPLACC